MELYILETTVAIIFAIIITIFFKLGKIRKVGISLAILMILLIIVLGITFILEKPIINITNQQSDLEVKQNAAINIPKTFYHFKDVTDTVKVIGNIDFNRVGTYEVKYEIPTLIGTYTVNQTVNIVDTTAPKIILNGEELYNQSYSKEYIEPGYTVSDNYDENLTEKVQVTKEDINEKEYNIIYSVVDSSGNKTNATRKVCIIDDIAPVIKLNGSENIQILVNSKYEEKGATANDEKDGDLTSKIETTGNVDTSKVGTYTITYKVSDNSGNVTTKIRKVTVYKKTVQAQNETNGKKGVIYLTFDDGPSLDITPHILDILKEEDIKATFFILDYNNKKEELVKREVEEGHSIGLHGVSHNYKEIYGSLENGLNNFINLNKKVKESTGIDTKLIRFPGGSSNTVSKFNPGIMTNLAMNLLEKGYKYYDWNVASGDSGDVKTKEAVYNNVTKGIRKNRNNIVLMHDFSGNSKTLNALRDIIKYGKANGYTFERITESTPMITQNIVN